jgi:hypothetical protein
MYVAAPTLNTGSSVTNKYAFVSESGAGNVGIGTTSPGAKLEITSNTEPYLLLKGGTSTTDMPELRLEQTTTGIQDAPKITFLNPDVSATDLSAISMRDGSAFTFEYPIGTELMKIDNTGNVGIGTTAPSYKLDMTSTGDWVFHAGDNAGNDFMIDIAGGQGLVSLVAGAKVSGNDYVFTGTRGASRIVLHDGLIGFFTSDSSSGTAGSTATGLTYGDQKVTITNTGRSVQRAN